VLLFAEMLVPGNTSFEKSLSETYKSNTSPDDP
jgi:hypothetical protein